jgi:hypothetical protein
MDDQINASAFVRTQIETNRMRSSHASVVAIRRTFMEIQILYFFSLALLMFAGVLNGID